jgi:hypothetical protein
MFIESCHGELKARSFVWVFHGKRVDRALGKVSSGPCVQDYLSFISSAQSLKEPISMDSHHFSAFNLLSVSEVTDGQIELSVVLIVRDGSIYFSHSASCLMDAFDASIALNPPSLAVNTQWHCDFSTKVDSTPADQINRYLAFFLEQIRSEH